MWGGGGGGESEQTREAGEGGLREAKQAGFKTHASLTNTHGLEWFWDLHTPLHPSIHFPP